MTDQQSFSLPDLLQHSEWYDNHKIASMRSCMRYAHLHLDYRGGLEAPVGNGAHFGSAVHAGLASYYTGWGQLSEQDRRIKALEAFSREYRKKFGLSDIIDKKHTEVNGLDILDHYFDQWLIDDPLYRPIESELAAIITIRPQPSDPPGFTIPFYWIFRVDGLWERIKTGDWLVLETKTTSGGAERELTRLKISHQPTGYVYGVRQFESGHKVVGCLGNVLAVNIQARDYRRDVIMKNDLDMHSWRFQTIQMVQQWRNLKEQTKDLPDRQRLLYYQQNTQHCTNYGLCPFYNTCLHGLEMAANININTWTPFEVVQEKRED